MLQNIIKIDYTLSAWFSKTSDKVIPGTAFLFLNKVVFLWTSLIILLMSLLKSTFSIQIWVSIVVSGALLIMYGFQKKIEHYVKNLSLNKSHSKQTKDQLRKDRILGLLLFCSSFFMIFLMVILFH